MKTNYILRKKNGDLIYFYYLNNNIFYKILRNNICSQENILVENTLDKFTINMLEEKIYIFYQNIKGDIVLCSVDIDFTNSTTNLILKKQGKNLNNMFFYPIVEKNNLCLLYNIPNLDRSFKIVTQNFSEDILAPFREIDNIFSVSSSIFQVQYISPGHLLIFYKLRSSDNTIGYKEITTNKTSKFTPIYKSNLPIIDYSFLATEECIHSLCIMQNLFSCQLIYKRKDKNTTCNPVIIFEGPSISNCLVSIIKKDIYVTFTWKNNLYLSISKDMGKTFSKSEILENSYKDIERASYISESFMDCNNLFIKDIYINKSNFPDISIFSKLYENYKDKEDINDNINENTDYYEKDDYKNINEKDFFGKHPCKIIEEDVYKENNYKEEVINSSLNLENKEEFYKEKRNKELEEIEYLKNIIAKKDEQIEYITNMLKKYKEEKSDLDLEQINIKNNFLKEIENLKNKIINLESINKNLENSLNNKKSQNQIQIQNKNKNNKNRRTERPKRK